MVALHHHHHHHHHHRDFLAWSKLQKLSQGLRVNKAVQQIRWPCPVMTSERECLETLSEYRERRCRCHVQWKTVPEDTDSRQCLIRKVSASLRTGWWCWTCRVSFRAETTASAASTRRQLTVTWSSTRSPIGHHSAMHSPVFRSCVLPRDSTQSYWSLTSLMLSVTESSRRQVRLAQLCLLACCRHL